MNTAQLSEPFPLSPMQQGMLFHNLSGREPGVDLEQIFCTLREDLEVAALERAWQRVVDRHAILRTTFHWERLAEPRQNVSPDAKIEFSFADWRGKTPPEQAGLFEARLESDRRRSFNLAEEPPQRVALFRLGESEYRLLWSFHHLLLDGRAVVLVFNEVFAFYEAFVRGEELEFSPPRPYREHVEWLRQQDLAAAEGFWRRTLKGFGAPTPLGAARVIDEGQQGESNRGEQQIGLSEATTTALKSIARKNGLTSNTLMQGAWALLLSRYSGEDDVVFGAIRACRSNMPGAASIVGLFINTVPMRVQIVPGMPLVSWLKALRESWKGIRDHEHTPLVNIQGWSDVPRGQPLFDTIFNFQDPSWDAALRAQGGKWANREFGIRSQSNYPLVADAYGGDAFLVKILYHRNRFDDETIGRMLGHLKTLLESMALNLGQSVERLPMLTEAERKELLVEWNRTAMEFPKDKCVHELFEEQAGRTPDAPAVADGKNHLTYRELSRQAAQLADHLRESGVSPEARVGVCMQRSVQMVAAFLAVWKAGGAYVPLDPSYPAERLAFILKDAKMPVFITQSALRDRFKELIPGVKLLCVDSFPDAGVAKDMISRKTKENQNKSTLRPSSGAAGKLAQESGARTVNSGNLAYVIYTSGSTGQPKGVEVEHRSLANLITWHQRAYQVVPADRATQVATPAFDASVWELWPYLTAGASIHFPDEDTRLSPAKLTTWLAANRITLSFIPTPILEKMLAESWPENCALRALLTGGDKLRRAGGKRLPCVLMNHYGPTENTVVTTWALVSKEERDAKPPPIGRPIANTQVHILDKNLQLVPIGVAGELYIGGESLARGYLGRPDLTAERFVKNPFERNAGARMYKTGDLVRWLPDGQIEFLGRMDHQAKIRGNRLELGEVESAINQHPAIQETLAVIREDHSGDNRLVAYMVPRTEGNASPNELRQFLRLKLPDYMVPAGFVFLESFPLTPNGKVDRDALPAPVFDTEAGFVAPQTATEQMLAGIWREVLGVERIGIKDNFFELGGHSLMATQVMARIHDALQVEFQIRDLFDSPTIAELARKVEAARGRRANLRAAPIVRYRRNGASPLSFAQERLWFMEQMEPGIPFNNIPLALRLTGALDARALQHALNELLRRHETLRTVFKNHGGQPESAVEPAQSFAVPVFDLSALSTDQRGLQAQRYMDEAARQPFDLAQDMLLRAVLLREAADEHLLLMTTHHIACDGWSLGILYRELSALYGAFLQNEAPRLPGPPIEHGDFAQWQREWMKGGVLEEQLDFWRRQLSGPPPALDLPTDRPRPAMQGYRGATKCFSLPRKLTADLEQLSRQEGATLFMLLVAALQTLLHRYSGQDDILIGSPVAGRTRVETENLIGFFLNTVVLRGDLSGDPTYGQLLQRTRRVALDAYAHQDLPFEKLVEALQQDRDLSRSPLFQVMFVLQNEPLAPLELAGLKIEPVHTHSGTAKFDLMFSVEQRRGCLNGFVEFNSDLFDDLTIARMLGHFQTLLEAVAANPDQRLSELPLLTRHERDEVLAGWNDTKTKYSEDKCVHKLIEEQAGRTPDAVAVVFEGEELTYRELNARADRFAGRLRGLGVGPEVHVGICLERSAEMMVGLLGILKAGGAYVPLDPAYPRDRLEFMLKDSQAPVLVTQALLRDRLRLETSALKVVCLDAPNLPGNERRDADSRAEPLAPIPENLAYVLYTSGSTGRPKGVMITHRNVVNFFTGMDKVLGTRPGVWLAVTSISFDISVLELFWTLARGFKVVIQPDETGFGSVAGPEGASPHGRRRQMPDEIGQHGVTHLQCTPSLAGALAATPESLEAMRTLDKLLLGGEALPVSLARQFRKVLRGRLINMYGPTETTVWSATHRVGEIGGAIPIGRPIANTTIYILNEHLQPQPAGVPGEIFIGGEGVARGYWNRPELTAEKFIRDPFGADKNSRLYRTGDLGRFRADGTIEFIGRVDHQVKIRGHRIELGEIETVLARHPAAREAVVMAREDSPGEARLVAYMVMRKEGEINELRRFLGDKLPAAMIPATFVFLDKLPLTPNGKVNRKALPPPEEERPRLETAYVAPQAPMETAIAGVWQELLRVDKVGLHDNFFDLGGHSLLVVQEQTILRGRLGIDLPVVKLFQYPTIHSLVTFLNGGGPDSRGTGGARGLRKQAVFARRKRQEHEVPV